MQINVLEYFDATVARFPDKSALVDRERTLSFKEAQSLAHSLASRLIGKADVVNQPIAVFLPKSADAVISFLAILSSGNFYVPLDVKSPAPRLQSILENLAPKLVITNQALQAELRKTGWSEVNTILIDSPEPGGAFGLQESRLRRDRVIDTDPVYIIYTSGSTGVPKGVVIPHRGVIDYIDWASNCYQTTEKEVIGSQAPFFFDNSTLDLYLCFSAGATLVLVPEDLFTFPVRLMEYARQTALTTIFWVPSVLANVSNFDVLSKTQLPPLTKILFAGEVMPTRTVNYWRKHYPQALFSNLYGPTEITVDCTYYIVDRELQDNEPLPIGIPCRNSDVLILNDQNQRSGAGEMGELCVRGSSLALGYWNSPEKTAAAFAQNPLNPHYPERIYRTGDIVYANPRGEIIFVGRKDSQIKHQGYRIELGEIETAALALPELGSACVLYNKDKKEITLFYEVKAEITPAQIRQKLSQNLSKYMLPTAFHSIPRLPLNANGKIDRLALAGNVLFPQPGRSRPRTVREASRPLSKFMIDNTHKLHHIGVLVRDIEGETRNFCSQLGYVVESEIVEDKTQTALCKFLRQPGSAFWLELIAPNGQESKLSNALRQGGGLHHLCYEVKDLDAECQRMVGPQTLLIGKPAAAPAFGGRRIAWLTGQNRLLIEFVESGPGPLSLATIGA